jgi:hypothetical protein
MAKPSQTVKGHNAEREYAKKFKALGFSFCMTSRQGSRIHDDAGIDLINVPFNVQVKSGYKRGLNIKTVIDYTKERIKELFPPHAPEHKLPTIVIHRKDSKPGKRRTDTDDLVYMTYKDFEQIIKEQYGNNKNTEGTS